MEAHALMWLIWALSRIFRDKSLLAVEHKGFLHGKVFFALRGRPGRRLGFFSNKILLSMGLKINGY